jgi:two-component system, sensor histidine kinase and response regulator
VLSVIRNKLHWGSSLKSSEPHSSDILIVDDTPANLQLLSGMLKERGHKVRPVPSGKLALQAARGRCPDLILLDINMPEMNGYEVCRQLKADADLQDVPVIFLSALSDTVNKLEGFRVGGVDYITKPFEFEEVHARLEAHLALRRAHIELEELHALRETLTSMIVHDLRGPLTGILGYLELLEGKVGSQLEEKPRRYLHRARQSSQALIGMISTLLDLDRLEAGSLPLERSDCDLRGLVGEACGLLAATESREVTQELPDEPVPVHCDAGVVCRVLANLLGNALKFTPSSKSVAISVRTDDAGTHVAVRDEGPGIAPEFHDRIFEKFGQARLKREHRGFSSGLGLAFCKLAVEAHGGTISVVSVVGEGSTFAFVLPRG